MEMDRHFDDCLPQGLVTMTCEQDMAAGSLDSGAGLPRITSEGVVCCAWSRNGGFYVQSLCGCSLCLGDQTGRNGMN